MKRYAALLTLLALLPHHAFPQPPCICETIEDTTYTGSAPPVATGGTQVPKQYIGYCHTPGSTPTMGSDMLIAWVKTTTNGNRVTSTLTASTEDGTACNGSSIITCNTPWLRPDDPYQVSNGSLPWAASYDALQWQTHQWGSIPVPASSAPEQLNIDWETNSEWAISCCLGITGAKPHCLSWPETQAHG